MSAVSFGDSYNPYECPIGHEIMKDPVSTPCGHTFERDEIVAWIAKNPTCPECRTTISVSGLISNRALAAAIERLPKEVVENLVVSEEGQEVGSGSPPSTSSKEINRLLEFARGERDERVQAQDALRTAKKEAAKARAQMRALEQRIEKEEVSFTAPPRRDDSWDELDRLMAELGGDQPEQSESKQEASSPTVQREEGSLDELNRLIAELGGDQPEQSESKQEASSPTVQRAGSSSGSTASSTEADKILALTLKRLEEEREARAAAEAAQQRAEEKLAVAQRTAPVSAFGLSQDSYAPTDAYEQLLRDQFGSDDSQIFGIMSNIGRTYAKNQAAKRRKEAENLRKGQRILDEALAASGPPPCSFPTLFGI